MLRLGPAGWRNAVQTIGRVSKLPAGTDTRVEERTLQCQSSKISSELAAVAMVVAETENRVSVPGFSGQSTSGAVSASADPDPCSPYHAKGGRMKLRGAVRRVPSLPSHTT